MTSATPDPLGESPQSGQELPVWTFEPGHTADAGHVDDAVGGHSRSRASGTRRSPHQVGAFEETPVP